MARVGLLSVNSPETSADQFVTLRRTLREHGWSEGQNIRFETRYANGDLDRLRALARELVRLNVDVIVAGSSSATRAAKEATSTVPIVMGTSTNAVNEGFVAALAHPGGNVTGVTFLAGTEIAGKQLELLRLVAPRSRRVAVLSNPASVAHHAFVADLDAAARSLGVELHVVEARTPREIAAAFGATAKHRADAIHVLSDSMFFGQRRTIVELALQAALPGMYSQREFVDAGGLVAYGPSVIEMLRRAALQVDKILKGMNPGDIPVEQPTKFDLVVNLKTARTLGLAIPQSVLLRADDVVER